MDLIFTLIFTFGFLVGFSTCALLATHMRERKDNCPNVGGIQFMTIKDSEDTLEVTFDPGIVIKSGFYPNAPRRSVSPAPPRSVPGPGIPPPPPPPSRTRRG